MSEITVAESLTFYWASPANRRAMDLVIANTMPDDLGWDELPTFITAKANGERLKADFWQFMRKTWEDTWGRAFAHAFPDHRMGSVENYDGEDVPTLETVWAQQSLNAWVELPNGAWIETAVFIEDEQNLSLRFTFSPEDFGVPPQDSIYFGPAWPEPNADEWYELDPSVPLKAGRLTTNDIADLTGSANAAVQALAGKPPPLL